MPMIKCPICGSEIDDMSEKCPHCGYQNTFTLDENDKPLSDNKNVKVRPYEKKKNGKMIWILPICALIVIFCILIIISARNNAESMKQIQKSTAESLEKQIEGDLKNINESETASTKSEEENNITILQQKTYEIGKDTFDFSFGQKESGEYSLILVCKIQEKYDAFMTHISLNALFNSEEESIKSLIDDLNFSYSILIGDGTYLLRGKNFLYLVNEEKEVIDVNDYFSTEWVLSEENRESDYGTQVSNFLADFIGGSENNDEIETESESEEILVYNDDIVSVEYVGISGSDTEYNIDFIIENLSDTTITVQFTETSINGFMVRPIGSIDIAPHKKAKDGMTIWGDEAEEYPKDSVESIETKLHIFSDDDTIRYDTENIVVK